MSFVSGTVTDVLYSLPAAVTKNTYTTQAVFSAPNTQARALVPAGYFGVDGKVSGKSLALMVRGTVATTSAATFNAVLGWDPTAGTLGTTLATPWPTLAPTAATTCVWELDVLITSQATGGAGLTLQTNGCWRQSVVASGVLSAAAQTIQFQSNSTALNSEAQAFIELWGTWSASAAGNTTTINQMVLLGLN